MNIPVLSRTLSRRAKRRLREMMRGYRVMRTNGKAGLVEDVKHSLATSQLHVVGAKTSAWIFGDRAGNADLVLRQYMMTRIAGLDLNMAILRSFGRAKGAVVAPLPAVWRKVLADHGLTVAHGRCAVLWAAYIFMLWIYGVLSQAREIASAIPALFRREQQQLANSACFDRLAPENLPPSDGASSYDIMTWYAGWPGRTPEVTSLVHTVDDRASRRAGDLPVHSVSRYLPVMGRPGQLARFAGWSVAATVLSGLDMLRGRWWHALMLHEATQAALVRLAAPGQLARDYLFHNSGWTYRPLWTYEAEKRGSTVLFYFYSTNCETFKLAHGYPRQTGNWEISSWPRYLVWDVHQAGFLKRAGLTGDIDIVGPIWFSGTAADLPEQTQPTIALFDVQPARDSIYRSLALGFEYYRPETAVTFAEHVTSVAEEHGLKVLWKRKREIGKRLHPTYRSKLMQLNESGSIDLVAPSAGAQAVIEAADIVVSMPFTSTALLARALGRPSCYYDPLGLLQKDDRAAHGIPLLQSRVELEAWIEAALSRQQ